MRVYSLRWFGIHYTLTVYADPTISHVLIGVLVMSVNGEHEDMSSDHCHIGNYQRYSENRGHKICKSIKFNNGGVNYWFPLEKM